MTPETLAKAFHKRFRGLERAYGTYSIQTQDGLKLKGQAKTLVGTVTDTLWLGHLEGMQGLGVTPINDDAQCIWGAIDIDVYDGLDIAALESRVQKERLPLVVCRTKSGGVHLLLFMQQPADAELVRDRLAQWAYLLGYPSVEIFPKQVKLANRDDVGSWLNMPYFNAEDTTRYCVRDGVRLSAAEFIEYANQKAVTGEDLEAFVIETDELLSGAPPCLTYLCKFGIPTGGRNNGMFQLAIYAKRRFKTEWEDKAREMNDRFLHPSLSSREVETIIRSVAKKDYAYKCTDVPMKSVCTKSVCQKTQYGIGLSEEDPGVELTDLTKMDTVPPVWYVTVDGKRVRVESTTDLILQDRFRVLCMDALNVLMRPLKREKWEKIVRDLLANVEVVEVPPDANLDGYFMDLVESFCTDSPRAAELGDLLNGAVFKDEEWWCFRSRDLTKFLQVHHFPERTPNTTWARLRTRNVMAARVTVNDKTMTFWKLPATAFADDTTTLEPRITKNEF